MDQDSLTEQEEEEVLAQVTAAELTVMDRQQRRREPVLEEKFDSKQIQELVENIRMLEQYQQYVSLEIKHHSDSIKMLKPEILHWFPELE